MRDCPNQSVNGLKDMWIMTVGPLAGGAFATLLAISMSANPWLFEDAERPALNDKALTLEGEGYPADANAALPIEANLNPDFNPDAARA